MNKAPQSSQVCYEQLLPKLKAIPADQVKRPPIPADVLWQEGETLAQEANKDRAALTKAGVNGVLIDSLAVRARAMRCAASSLNNASKAKAEAKKLWTRLRKEGWALRNELVRTFRYAYHSDKERRRKLAQIQKGSSGAELIADLAALVELAQVCPKPLEMCGFDMARLSKTSNLAQEMGSAQAAATASTSHGSALDMRNRAATYLLQAMRTVRRAGKFVYQHNEKHLRAYSSAYERTRRRQRKAKAERAG